MNRDALYIDSLSETGEAQYLSALGGPFEKQRPPEEYQEMVREILRESEFTAELIEQFLTLARTDAEREQLSLTPIDLRELVQEIDFGSRTLADRQGLSWSSEIPSQSVAVLGDGPHLRRLLLILIHNACRYKTADGKVRLRLRRETRKPSSRSRTPGSAFLPKN